MPVYSCENESSWLIITLQHMWTKQASKKLLCVAIRENHPLDLC